MWNKFLGKKSGGSEGGNGGGVAAPPSAGDDNADTTKMDAASTGGGSGGGSGTTPAADNTAAAPAGDAVVLKKKLTAILWQGNKVTVRILLNNQLVSAPSSAVEDNDDGMEEDGIGGLEGRQDLDRSFSGSIKTDTSNTSMDQEPPAAKSTTKGTPNEPTEDSNNSTTGSDMEDDDDSRPTRRGRSASIDQTGETGDSNTGGSIRENNFSRENSTSSEAPPIPSNIPINAAAENFEASLLLGIAESTTATPNSGGGITAGGGVGISSQLAEKEKREIIDPTTLPTSMTSFLDMLTEDQRRVRHRHIPGVDGFRKLYKAEVKSDMSEARRMKRAKVINKESKDALNAMDVEGENDDENTSTVGSDGNAKDEKEEKMPDRDAFVVPCKEVLACANAGQLAGMIDSTDFENAIKNDGGTVGGNSSSTANATSSSSAAVTSSLKSPRLVTSLTSFNPPRPAESMGTKTKHRLARWEAHPHEVEVDLNNYRKTVTRTRTELHNAKKEHIRIEAVASLVRGHFMNHLNGYRKEVVAVNEQLQSVNGNCLRLEEVYNGRSMSTRGSVKGMKDVLGTLKALGEDIKGEGGGVGSSGGTGDTDEAMQDWRVEGIGGVSCKRADVNPMASGWILAGDDIIITSSGVEGKVVYVDGPAAADLDMGGYKHTIGVKLAISGQIRQYSPSQVVFNPSKLPTFVHTTDPILVKRWEDMLKTALVHGVNHDVLAMEEYINASFVVRESKESLEDAAAAAAAEDDTATATVTTNKEDGSGSPKSVMQYDDARTLLPFGSGLIAAPEDVKKYPSLIPLDRLEERVRKVVYEAEKPRVIPTMSSDVKQYESQQEEMNQLKGKVMQLRNRLGRQKRLRSLNERSLVAGKSRSHKVEGLLLEMQMDLKNLKERLQDELHEIGIGNSPVPSSTPKNGADDNEMDTLEDESPKEEEEDEKPSSPQVLDAVADQEGGDVIVSDKEESDPKEGAGDSGDNNIEKPLPESKEEVTTTDITVLPGMNAESTNNELERESKRARVDE